MLQNRWPEWSGIRTYPPGKLDGGESLFSLNDETGGTLAFNFSETLKNRREVCSYG